MVRIVYYEHESDTWEEFVERLRKIRKRAAPNTEELALVDEVLEKAEFIEELPKKRDAESEVRKLLRYVLERTAGGASVGHQLITALDARYGLIVPVKRCARNFARVQQELRLKNHR